MYIPQGLVDFMIAVEIAVVVLAVGVIAWALNRMAENYEARKAALEMKRHLAEEWWEQ